VDHHHFFFNTHWTALPTKATANSILIASAAWGYAQGCPKFVEAPHGLLLLCQHLVSSLVCKLPIVLLLRGCTL
jgi:hypothetical protein